MTNVVDLKQLETAKEQNMFENAEKQLEKIWEHSVFYAKTKSFVEFVGMLKRYVHQHNMKQIDNLTDLDFTSSNLMTVKHFAPRVNHFPDEFFSNSEKKEKLDMNNSDEFSYVTALINAVIHDMFATLNVTIQANIDDKKQWLNYFSEEVVKKVYSDYQGNLNKLKSEVIQSIIQDVNLKAIKEENSQVLNQIVDNYLSKRKNLTDDKRQKVLEYVPFNTGAMTHVYVLPSYLLKTNNDRLKFAIQYLLEIVMSSFYEFKKVFSGDYELDICNTYRVVFAGEEEDAMLMPITGYKLMNLNILSKDLVMNYLDIYETRIMFNSYLIEDNKESQISAETRELFYQTFKHLSFDEFATMLNTMAFNEIHINDKFIHINRNYRIDKNSGLTPIISSVTFKQLGGMDNIQSYVQMLKDSLENPDKLQVYNIESEKGMLVCGLAGTGKSSIPKAMGNELGIPVFQFEVGAFMNHLVGRSENNIKSFLDAIQKEGKCILWIDEFEKAFAGASGEVYDSGTSNRVYQIFLTFLQENNNVILVATANDLTKLPPEFMRSGRFDKKFFVDIPSKQDRVAIFKVIMERHNLHSLITNENLETLSEISEHFTGADIQKVVEIAIRRNIAGEITINHVINEVSIHKPDAQSFKEQYKTLRKRATDFEPSSKNSNESRHLGFEDYLTLIQSDITLENVGGMDRVKEKFQDCKTLIENIDKAHDYGVNPVKNFVFSGVPGTGKSLIIKSGANYLGLKLYRLDLGSLFNKYVGESFKNVKFALDAATSLAEQEMIVLWMDELEKLFNNMNNSSTESHILQYFLTWLEENKSVIVMATANDLSRIPVELIRSGRFDNKFFVDLPTLVERKEIIKGVLAKINSKAKVQHYIEDVNHIAEKTKGFTGGDISNVIESAISKSLIIGKDNLNNNILMSILENYQPDSKTHSDKYQTIREDYGSMFQPASSEGKFHERLDTSKFLRKVDTSSFNFKTVGGLTNIKKYVENESYFFLNSNEAKDFGIQIPKGIMLTGYSGCGKTAIAKATSSEMGIDMYMLSMSDIVNKFVGQTEDNFKKALDAITRISHENKVMLLIDEFDKAFGQSHTRLEHSQNILQEFLYFLQEEHDNLFIVVTANDTTRIPPELMRSGRFDKKFFVNLPTFEERETILDAIISKSKNKFSITKELKAKVAGLLEGFTGADIENMFNQVVKLKFKAKDFNKKIDVKYFNEVLSSYTPDTEMLKYQIDESIIKQFTPGSKQTESLSKKNSIGFIAAEMKSK